MVKKKQSNEISKQMKLLLLIAVILIGALAVLCMSLLNNKNAVSSKLQTYERCTALNGGFQKDDRKLETCTSYSDVKSIKKDVQTYEDCEEDYFERTGIRRATAAPGSDDPDHSELIECKLPDGRVMYSSSLGHFMAEAE